MYTLRPTKRFEKDFKLCMRRGLDLELIGVVFELLVKTGNLPSKYKPHKLRGNYVNHLECHIQPDWLLIWFCDETKKEIHLIRTGTHSDLF